MLFLPLAGLIFSSAVQAKVWVGAAPFPFFTWVDIHLASRCRSSRGAWSFSAIDKSGPRSVRNQLFWSGQHHESCLASDEEAEKRPYFSPLCSRLALSPCLLFFFFFFFFSIKDVSNHWQVSHLGTPGLGAYSAVGWAFEGFCDVSI